MIYILTGGKKKIKPVIDMPRLSGHLTQVIHELDTIVFARVTGIRGKDKVDFGGPDPPVGMSATDDVVHFYGFAKCLSSSDSIWFKKLTHVTSLGNPGMFIGPVQYQPSVTRFCDLPKRHTLVAGKVMDSGKGPMFTWWVHNAEPLYAFYRTMRATSMRVSGSLYRELALHDQGGQGRDDLWALARVLVAGDLACVLSSMIPPSKRDMHPLHKDGYVRQRGLQLAMTPVQFVWHASEFARDTTIFKRFLNLLTHRKLWSPELETHVREEGWTMAELHRVLPGQPC